MKNVLGFMLISLLAACASQTTQPTAEVEDRSPATPSATDGRSSTGEAAPTLNPLTDPSNILSTRSIYFDFDSYVVKDEYRSLVQAHAQYLRDNTGARVLLQGNTDERGSREYNLALGQRRADAVRKALTLLGAREPQIESVSLGEEKPRATGHDESSWAENRRTDIRYQGE
ncbi:peptidoglycan-associated lipoprotein Pal [Nitrosovibrio sp. Nv17]|uniref:peptidoglycan-associated lipoprotein Pal n=1 Tax=Nitrosovibrio sp. Nv17 TaxID=1855339 RepID=UPI0009091CDD|nr:peptidoglycan-associated lipoprotein Pal [Nitrosovibrio sp. Nv17]SFW27872.1 peptidoglycan-associated lipoprotein [Nitrosovibrio sp. Nv17]